MSSYLVRIAVLSVVAGSFSAVALAQDKSRGVPGINGDRCKRSEYNCSLNVDGRGQRVRDAAGSERWAVDMKRLQELGFVDKDKDGPAIPVLDGNGQPIGYSTNKSFTLNVGQKRKLNGADHAFALSTGLKAGGWVNIDVFVERDQLRANVGNIRARGAQLKLLECYEVGTTYDASFENYKVVRGATDRDEMEPNDYLPAPRANGKVYQNLAYNVPGDALGGPAIDIFPAGTKYQQVQVTTDGGKGSGLDVTLYEKDPGTGAYTIVSARKMPFIYGYIKAADGERRYGWMPVEGLQKSADCPKR